MDSSRNDGRRIFLVQTAAIVLMVLLLHAGYYWRSTVRTLDASHHLQRGGGVHLWDGRVWYIWAFSAPLIFWLIRSTPLSRERWLRATLRLVAGSVAIYLAVTNARYAIRILTSTWPANTIPGPSWNNFVGNQTLLLPLDLITYCGFFAASFAIDSYFKYRQRADEVLILQLQAAQLQSQLTGAQLSALRGQLQPHFLFNAFNAIAMLVRSGENTAAVDMIARVGELLRLAMDNVHISELPLEQEFHFAVCYLEVEQVRFSDKLRTEIALAPAARRCLVPNLLLQPLVENAVKHGIARRTDPGFVRLLADRSGDRLQIEVRDDGPGGAAPPAASAGERAGQVNSGIGLRNTRSRLRHAYGDDYRLEINRLASGGTSVRLDLPWRDKRAAAAS